MSAYGWQLSPQDFHAVFEAYLDGKWYLFDATRIGPLDGIVRIGIGRDAADTAFSTYFGALNPTKMKVWIDAIDSEDKAKAWTTDAISVAAAWAGCRSGLTSSSSISVPSKSCGVQEQHRQPMRTDLRLPVAQNARAARNQCPRCMRQVRHLEAHMVHTAIRMIGKELRHRRVRPSGVINSILLLSRSTKTTVTPCSGRSRG